MSDEQTTLRTTLTERLEQARREGVAGSPYGRFHYLSRQPKARFSIVVQRVGRWDVVSVLVDRKSRHPTWDELRTVKNLFWLPSKSVQVVFPGTKVRDRISIGWRLAMWCNIDDAHVLPTIDDWSELQ